MLFLLYVTVLLTLNCVDKIEKIKHTVLFLMKQWFNSLHKTG